MYGHQGRQLYNPDSIEDCHEHLLYSVSTTDFELHDSERESEREGEGERERREERGSKRGSREERGSSS